MCSKVSTFGLQVSFILDVHFFILMEVGPLSPLNKSDACPLWTIWNAQRGKNKKANVDVDIVNTLGWGLPIFFSLYLWFLLTKDRIPT